MLQDTIIKKISNNAEEIVGTITATGFGISFATGQLLNVSVATATVALNVFVTFYLKEYLKTRQSKKEAKKTKVDGNNT